jgi:hypothetical protein
MFRHARALCHHFLTFPPIRQCAFIRHFLPVERLRTWHLARSIVASVTVSSPQSRLSVITCCRIFSVRFKHSTRNVSSHTFVSHVPFHRSALAGRSSDFVDSRPIGFGSAVLPFPFGSRLAAPGAMRRSSPRAPFRQARCLSRRSPRLQASAIAPREHFFLGPGTAHAALPIFRPRKGIEPTRR